MPNLVKFFIFVVVFIIGISVGTYLGIDKNVPIENKKEDNNDTIIPVQDIVIRNTQEEKKDDEFLETNAEEAKLSPYAKMIIEKKFTKCGHSSVEVIDIPNELINMTEKDIAEKYKNWEIRSFSSKEVSLYREIVANCDDHFVLKEKDGFLAVYKNITDDTLNLHEVTDIDISNLPSGDIKNIKKGIKVYGKDELSSLLEDFNS